MQDKKIDLALFDDLTGFYNRRYLTKKQEEIKAFHECSVPYSVVMFDIDNFKEINDTYGHLKGDHTIKDFSSFLKTSLRAGDSIVRYGGDEFLFFMFNTDKHDAEQVCERILKRCEEKKFGGLDINLSAGIASFPEDGTKFDGLLKLADDALYEAKRSGKNRIGNLKTKELIIPSKLFVNRKHEKEVLINGLNSNLEFPSVYFVKGNIGIGKTRLVKEVLKSISGKEVLWSNCISFLEEIPYFPIREILKYKLRRRGKSILESIPIPYRLEIGKLIPEVLIGLKNTENHQSAEIDGYRLYESIVQVIMKGRLPKILVVDNMQWIDNASIAFLTYLLRIMKDINLKFLFIYREEENNDRIEDFSSYISRENAVQEISLKPLETPSIRHLLKSLLGDIPSENLVRYIRYESGGNPFFIEELMRELNIRNYLRMKAGKWFFNEPTIELLPKSVNDIIIRKYESLGEKHREILDVASVIGKFELDIISNVVGLKEDKLVEFLEDIYNMGLIDEQNRRIVFREEISRFVIYNAKINVIRKRVLHKKVGEILEEKYENNLMAIIEELAFHFYHAGNVEKGSTYSLKAGNKALETRRVELVRKYYTWADELLGNSV